MKIPSEDQFVKGETFAELAANINAYMEAEEWHIDPIDEQTIVASIEAYNELCATGADGKFGKRADYLVPIEQGPFFAVPRGANSVPAVLGGLTVNENQQCLGAEGAPIEGLFAVGNASGQFYGGVDYPMDVEGLSIGAPSPPATSPDATWQPCSSDNPPPPVAPPASLPAGGAVAHGGRPCFPTNRGAMNATRYNGPMEKTPALREKRRLDNLEQMIPYLFALGCAGRG